MPVIAIVLPLIFESLVDVVTVITPTESVDFAYDTLATYVDDWVSTTLVPDGMTELT